MGLEQAKSNLSGLSDFESLVLGDQTSTGIFELEQEQIRHLGPKELEAFWGVYMDLAQIPHGSRHEGPLRDHIKSLSEEKGHTASVDRKGNLAIWVPGKGTGAHSKRGIILQSHLDAYVGDGPDAAERAKKPIIPFLHRMEIKDQLHDYGNCLVLQGKGTSGIGDNLVGVSMQTTIGLTDAVANHPPLLLLYLVQEEIGLFGAQELDPNFLSDKDGVRYDALINIDSGRPNAIRIGSAAGKGYNFTFQSEREVPSENEIPISISLTGLKGGHSGLEIDRPHANAIQTLTAAVLDKECTRYNLKLASFEGGTGNGAIPKSARMVLWCSADLADDFKRDIESSSRWSECRTNCDEHTLVVTTAEVNIADALDPIPEARSREILDGIMNVPHGVQESYSPLPDIGEIPFLSNNVAKVITNTKNGNIRFQIQSRSFDADKMREFQSQVVQRLRNIGAREEVTNNYSACLPNLENQLIPVAASAMEANFGAPPAIIAQHSGLEIGELQAKKPTLSIISIGPKIGNHHQLSEYVVVSTVLPTYRSLVSLLSQYASSKG